MLMLIKDINIKTLTSGDKSARIVLEVANPEDIVTIAALHELLEVEVEFKLTTEQEKNNIEPVE